MLTALDFPEELLYGDHAVWVRDDGAGSVRIGLHAYALGKAGEEALHVRLPRPEGRIARGEVFGHVEFEGSTFDLVAPVSGDVLTANRDLRDDPSLVLRDPFGRGFLLDVEDVPRAEIAALLRRDRAFARYARLPGESLAGAQRVEAGCPWPTSLALELAGGARASARLLASGPFIPDWEPGDRWEVEARAGDAAPRRFAYEVEDVAKLFGEECWRVRVVEVAPAGGAEPAEARLLLFRRDDFTLAAIDIVPLRSTMRARRALNPRGREAWLATGEGDPLPLDHPRIPAVPEDGSRDVPPTADGAAPALVAWTRVRAAGTRLESELRAGELTSVLVWEAGAPWWREARRLVNDREALAARLVSSRP